MPVRYGDGRSGSSPDQSRLQRCKNTSDRMLFTTLLFTISRREMGSETRCLTQRRRIQLGIFPLSGMGIWTSYIFYSYINNERTHEQQTQSMGTTHWLWEWLQNWNWTTSQNQKDQQRMDCKAIIEQGTRIHSSEIEREHAQISSHSWQAFHSESWRPAWNWSHRSK